MKKALLFEGKGGHAVMWMFAFRLFDLMPIPDAIAFKLLILYPAEGINGRRPDCEAGTDGFFEFGNSRRSRFADRLSHQHETATLVKVLLM